MSSFFLDESTAKRYTLGRPFSYGGINYTKQGATAETFKGLGFKEVQIQQPRPDDRFYIVSGPDDKGAYNATPRDHIELVGSYIEQFADQCHSLLAPSDWMVVRKGELGTEIPADWAVFRAECRNVCGKRQAQVMGAKDTPELEKLVKAPAEVPVDPDDPDAGMKPNPEPHLEPWPLDPTQAPAPVKKEAAGSRTRGK